MTDATAPSVLWHVKMFASAKVMGLGVKDPELQNRCLLMKFINKLFSIDLLLRKTGFYMMLLPLTPLLMGLKAISRKLLMMK
jgi:hypothetical protein